MEGSLQVNCPCELNEYIMHNIYIPMSIYNIITNSYCKFFFLKKKKVNKLV